MLDEALAGGPRGRRREGRASPYAAGRRGKAWRKVKPVRRTTSSCSARSGATAGGRAGSRTCISVRATRRRRFVMVGKTFKGMTDELLRGRRRRCSSARRAAAGSRCSSGRSSSSRSRSTASRPPRATPAAWRCASPGSSATGRTRPPAEADTIDDLRGLLHGAPRAVRLARATERSGHGRRKGRRQPRNGPGGRRARHDRVPGRRSRRRAREAVTMFLTKDAVRLALAAWRRASRARAARRSSGCSSSTRRGRRAARLPDLLQRARARRGGARGEREIGGATPLWDWIGDEPATVFSY